MLEPGPITGRNEHLKARWIAGAVTIRPGASPEALDAFEARYGVVLPPAVRAYFAAVDGTGDEMEGESFRFWPLAEVLSVRDYFRDIFEDEPTFPAWTDRWFLFIDHLINSFFLAVRLSHDPAESGPVARVDGFARFALAPSFAEFLDLYLAEPRNLFGHGTEIREADAGILP